MDGLTFSNSLTVQHNVMGGEFNDAAAPLALDHAGCLNSTQFLTGHNILFILVNPHQG
jgi:hypothetical protein